MLKTLSARVGQYKKDSILAPLFTVLEAVMETLIPLLMASIIDQGIEAGDVGHVYQFGLYMILTAGMALLFGVLAGRFAARASTGFACNLRADMYRNIQTFSFSNIDKYSTAGLITRLTTDVTNLQNAFQMILRMCVRAPVTMLCALVMAVSISPRLSSVFLIAMVFLVIVLLTIMVPASRMFRQVFRKYDDLNASVQENVSAIRVVKSFVREAYENEKFRTAADNLYRLFVKTESRISFTFPSMMLAVYGCNLGLSWLGAQMIVGGSLTTGQLTQLFSYVMNILMGLMMLSMVFVMITMSAASAQRISEVLNESSDLHNPPSPETEIPDGSVDFDHVSFAYQKGTGAPVLQDIDLHIRSGETIGIIGGTGSAKSSLVNLISRLYDVTGGSVKVGGRDVRSYDLDALRNQVSVVLQKNVLFSGTILENLRWGDKNATVEECERACRLACADEFIQKMPDKYETHLEQGGTNVSGGQKQRLCIARALLKKPKVLILDDSTSAVDTATDSKIRQAFREEIPGTTKLIIAQRISSVQDADRILVLDDGHVSGFGTHAELLQSNSIYREVYESQTQGGDFDKLGGED
ncbi:ABC transporter ATP-binding protein/permease [Oscillibacter sp. MSJ-2]|uniref:ABC transporter ATP-binding protein/permease n=1 Tax=Dysosmobacter acutus TaxID=2841504 RepID=A0ABS6F983_9FIRM|nr:ABC transporter ATP-binding protein [Dysosmobacter acutus]MBU5626630.1 ABC transporter ATP-binding protein/permease [Dysosmobacter acutus]